MQRITLDAHQWASLADFYDALLWALGAPEWHGKNINALIDSMIYGGINKVEPPYTIKIEGFYQLRKSLKNEITSQLYYLLDARDSVSSQARPEIYIHIT